VRVRGSVKTGTLPCTVKQEWEADSVNVDLAQRFVLIRGPASFDTPRILVRFHLHEKPIAGRQPESAWVGGANVRLASGEEWQADSEKATGLIDVTLASARRISADGGSVYDLHGSVDAHALPTNDAATDAVDVHVSF
jgi:hypothetical protein